MQPASAPTTTTMMPFTAKMTATATGNGYCHDPEPSDNSHTLPNTGPFCITSNWGRGRGVDPWDGWGLCRNSDCYNHYHIPWGHSGENHEYSQSSSWPTRNQLDPQKILKKGRDYSPTNVEQIQTTLTNLWQAQDSLLAWKRAVKIQRTHEP